MEFELVVFTKSWLLSHGDDHDKMSGIRKLINRSYDKPRYKFGIITTSRVKAPQTFLEDFGLLGSKYGFCLFVLLGPKDTFDKLNQQYGYFRNFGEAATPQTIFDNDIKSEYEDLFNFDALELKPKVILADSSTSVDDLFLSRVLGCVGFKTSQQETKDSIQLDLTAFTSFLRGSGPKLIDLVLLNVLEDPKNFSFLKDQGMIDEDIKKYNILADCITEHNLVDFYVKRCGFSLTGEEDLLIEVGTDGRLKNNPYEDGIMATKDFHISFLQKTHSRP